MENKIKAAGMITCIWIILVGFAWLIEYHFGWFVGLIFIGGTLFIYYMVLDALRDG